VHYGGGSYWLLAEEALLGCSTDAEMCSVMDNPSVHPLWDRLAADKLTDSSQHSPALGTARTA